MPIFAVTTRSKAEKQSAEDLINQSESTVYTAVAPHTLSGYFFVEAETRESVERAASRVNSINKVLPGETSLDEVTSFLEEKSDVEKVAPGVEVIVTEGAYEGNVAEVTRVNEGEETVTVKFPDEPIPIPVELPGSQIRVEPR